MVCESRIGLEDPLGFLAPLAQQLGLEQRLHRGVRHTMLAGTHQLAHAAYVHVLLRQLETVADARQELEPPNAFFRRIVGQHQASAWRRSATDPTPKLMEPGQAEAIPPPDPHYPFL